MFFAEDDLHLQIIGVFKIVRGSANFATSKRTYHVLSQRISGKAEVFFREDAYSLKEGDILYLPPNIDYSQSTEGETVIAVHMNIVGYEGKEINVLSPQNKVGSKDAFERIHEEGRVRRYGYQYRSLAILYDLLADLHVQSVHASVDSKEFDVIKDAVQYMDSRYMDPSLTIEQAAAHSNISTVYFRRVFKSVYGVTPLKHLISLRIQYAKRLLASGYYKIYEIAEMSGFSDVKYFSTVFKKETGKAPSEYAEHIV